MGKKKPAADLKRTEKYRKIKADILARMERNGTDGRQFLDLVDDYMALWETKEMLVWDIKTRGVAVPYDHGGGQKGMKKNESVGDLLKVNTQMLRILQQLGIEPTREPDDDGEVL